MPMKQRQTIPMAALVAAVLVASVLPVWAETATHSGTIAAIDRTAGSFVLDEIGPWRVKGGETEITRRPIAVTSTTEFKLAKRTPGAGPTGWVGEFVEAGLTASELKSGDFVTVKVKHEGRRLTALQATVVRP
jgi:hypothetical protein